MRDWLTQGLAELKIQAPPEAVERMELYGALLLEQNRVMNLTAITDPEQVARLHFLDSAALLGCAELAGARLIDVGTGAGFPGMVLKILVPDLKLTLADSLGKRLDWLDTVCRRLELTGVEIVHCRAEEQGLVPGFRDGFDYATARAVAELRVLAELCLPFVRPGGRMLAMKAAGCLEEVSAAAHAVQTLGAKLLPSYHYHIPGTDVDRVVVMAEKEEATPKGYPRRWAKIQKAPL